MRTEATLAGHLEYHAQKCLYNNSVYIHAKCIYNTTVYTGPSLLYKNTWAKAMETQS